jgi:hypothetical protein
MQLLSLFTGEGLHEGSSIDSSSFINSVAGFYTWWLPEIFQTTVCFPFNLPLLQAATSQTHHSQQTKTNFIDQTITENSMPATNLHNNLHFTFHYLT